MDYKSSFRHKLDGQFDINIIVDFFIIFSRFEFALKNGGFVKADGSKNAEADWTSFAAKNRGKFQDLLLSDRNESLRIDVGYLLTHPPKKLKLIDNKLKWEPISSVKEQNLKEVLEIVRCLRNNLFHGSKSFQVVEGSRDCRLLSCGLTVLNECLNIDTDLGEVFLDELG